MKLLSVFCQYLNSFSKARTKKELERLMSPTVDQTLAELRTLTDSNIKTQDETLVQKANEYRQDSSKRPNTWQEIFELELIVIKLLPPNLLLPKMKVFASKYECAGLPKIPFQESIDKDLEEDYLNRCRDYTAILCAELQWSFRKAVLIQKSTSNLRNIIFFLTIIYMIVWFMLHEFTNIKQQLIISTMMMGFLGSVVSALRRISTSINPSSKTNESSQSYRDFTSLEKERSSVVFSIMTGPIFGYLIMLILESKMIPIVDKSLIPDFRKISENYSDYDALVEIAKLKVWCFFAGFAEQLVPDVLDKLTGKSTTK